MKMYIHVAEWKLQVYRKFLVLDLFVWVNFQMYDVTEMASIDVVPTCFQNMFL